MFSTTEPKYDALVIGSGIGGLTCAAMLAKFGKKILVLEQHTIAGGFTHEFMRKGKYKWDVGIHYVGFMRKGQDTRKGMDYITDGKLDWTSLPELYENWVYPDLKFSVPSDPIRFEDELVSRFPNEEKHIRQYFVDIRKAYDWFVKHLMAQALPHPADWVMDLWNSRRAALALCTTRDYLDKHFTESKLKALLASTWGDYGAQPKDSAFAMHATLTCSYLQGAFYPVGGAEQIAKTIIPTIERPGGKVLTGQWVKQILVKDNAAFGVEVQTRQGTVQYKAEAIISDAGAYNTYARLLPQDAALKIRDQIQTFPSGTSMATLYLGLKENPTTMGFKGEQYWFFDSYDHNQDLQQMDQKLLDGNPPVLFLSFPSLKNPKATTHTAEIITCVQAEPFKKWKNQPWLKRDKDYYALKEQISRSLLETVEKKIPGFTKNVDYAELSTPLTVEHFSARRGGEIYGVIASPQRLAHASCRIRTPIQNLYQTGTDVSLPGIPGAYWGGVMTACVILGPLGIPKIFHAIEQDAKKRKAQNMTEKTSQ